MGRGWLGQEGAAHSLTPPANRISETMYFCRYWNSRMTGTAARFSTRRENAPRGGTLIGAAHVHADGQRELILILQDDLRDHESHRAEMKLSRLRQRPRTGRTSGMMIVQSGVRRAVDHRRLIQRTRD